ncbi:hypothetical protein ON010_g8030 [Phytophthora cinnamomi]|nr:hypothetical protein ON010_g8030 [Phytophthora cinnamomi]
MQFLALLLLVLAARLARGVDDGAEQTLSIARLQRDPLLDAPLGDLLLTPLEGDAAAQLDARLQSAFIQCRELGATSLMYESGIDASGVASPPLDASDVAYCNRLRYVRHQRQHYRGVRRELAAQTETPERRQEVDKRAADDVSFQEFFELYAEKARPVVLQLKDDARDPTAQLLGLDDAEEAAASPSALEKFLSVCFGGDTQRGSIANDRIETRPLRVEDEACAALLETTFRVPIYMTHDYVQRTNASREEAFLPVIIELPPELDAPESAMDIVACPYGLHMLAMPIGDDTVSGVRVSLFDRKFEPIAAPPSMRDQLREVALGADASVASSSETTVLDADFFQQAPKLYSGVELEPGRNVLFVPGGVVSTMRPLASSSSSRAAKVLRFCYCDAANVKDVKQAAGVDALRMTSDNKDEAVYGLLHALQSPGFDSTFSRRPTSSDTSWSTFVKWPRDPAYLARKNRRHKSGANGDDQEGEEEQLSRRERLKQWQDDKRWERYIASLTLPVAWPPIVVNTTRTTATLRWQELYQPLKHDLTSYGYEVSWKREEHEEQSNKYDASPATEVACTVLTVSLSILADSGHPSQQRCARAIRTHRRAGIPRLVTNVSAQHVTLLNL